MENRIINIIQFEKTIRDKFLKRLSSATEIRSVFVVGSMCDPDYNFQPYNDYDLRILVDDITSEILSVAEEAMSCCVSSLQMKYPNGLFSSSNLVGPVRCISKGNITSLLIHYLLLTPQSLDNLPVMHKVSYRKNYRLLWGEDPLKKYDQLKLSLSGILKDTEGIEYCIQHLRERNITYLLWEIMDDNNCLLNEKKEPFTQESGFEFSKYSIHKCTNNLREYLIQEKMTNYLNELSSCIIKSEPKFTYADFINNTEYCIRLTENYLNELHVFAKKITSTNGTPRN